MLTKNKPMLEDTKKEIKELELGLSSNHTQKETKLGEMI